MVTVADKPIQRLTDLESALPNWPVSSMPPVVSGPGMNVVLFKAELSLRPRKGELSQSGMVGLEGTFYALRTEEDEYFIGRVPTGTGSMSFYVRGAWVLEGGVLLQVPVSLSPEHDNGLVLQIREYKKDC